MVLNSQGFDWNSPDIDSLLNGVAGFDYILGADVFYDPKVFEPLVKTIAELLRRCSKSIFMFAFEERESVFIMELSAVYTKCECEHN